MEKLQIHTGQICLDVVDDHGESRGVFKFNPNDITTARKVFSLQETLNTKFEEYDKQFNEVKDDAGKSVELFEEVIKYCRDAIDEIFGAGTSQILFGDANTFQMFEDFFDGITPYYTKASKERVQKYQKQKK
jgi:hypothetical protein